MVYLIDYACAQSDLVSVTRVSLCRCGRYGSLRKLARESLGYRLQRISCSRDSHCGVSVRPARKRVSYASAEACCSAAKRLDLGRMVVCLILEEQQPRLVLAVDLNVHHYCACVDLFGLIKLVELSFSLQMSYRDSRDVHECDRLVPSELSPDTQVILVCLLKQRIFKCDTVDDSVECRMPAVVGPVGIDHAELGDGRIPVLCVAEVLHAHCEIRLVHGKTHGSDAAPHLRLCHVVEALEHLDLRRDLIVHLESLRHVEGSLSRLYRVDHVIHDCVYVSRHELAVEHVYSGKSYRRSLSAAYYLHALLS